MWQRSHTLVINWGIDKLDRPLPKLVRFSHRVPIVHDIFSLTFQCMEGVSLECGGLQRRESSQGQKGQTGTRDVQEVSHVRILWMRGTCLPERRGHPSCGRRARVRHAGSRYRQQAGRRRGVLIVLNVRVIEAVASSHAEGVDSSLT